MKANITGSNIRKIRLMNNLTQEDLAIKLNLQGLSFDRTIISKIENGIREVTDIELLYISKALNVSILDLFENYI